MFPLHVLFIRMDELQQVIAQEQAHRGIDTKIMGKTHSKDIRAALLVAWNRNDTTQYQLELKNAVLFYLGKNSHRYILYLINVIHCCVCMHLECYVHLDFERYVTLVAALADDNLNQAAIQRIAVCFLDFQLIGVSDLLQAGLHINNASVYKDWLP
jgi:hypothetical protein